MISYSVHRHIYVHTYVHYFTNTQLVRKWYKAMNKLPLQTIFVKNIIGFLMQYWKKYFWLGFRLHDGKHERKIMKELLFVIYELINMGVKSINVV